MVTVKNKFDTVQETSEGHNPNEEYENFVITHKEARADSIPTKLRSKGKVSWESTAVREKRDNMKKAS